MHRVRFLLAAAALTLVPTAAPAAQVRLTAMVGVTGTSTLVNDLLIEPIEVKPALEPTFLLSGSLPLSAKVRASLDLGYGSSTADLTVDGADAGDLGSLGAFTASAALAGPLWARLSWRLSVGVLQYLPSEEEGVFADGVPLAALFGAGLDWRQPISDRWAGVAGLRYDYHKFTTDALEAAGFSGSQQVSRLGLAVGAAWELP